MMGPIVASLRTGFVFSSASPNARAESTAVLTGNVSYLSRMVLPPDAELQVVLADTARQDVSATLIAETTVLTEGRQVPIPFELRYDLGRIEARGRYSVRATLAAGDGWMLFRTTKVLPVVLGETGGVVEIQLDAADGGTVTRKDGGEKVARFERYLE